MEFLLQVSIDPIQYQHGFSALQRHSQYSPLRKSVDQYHDFNGALPAEYLSSVELKTSGSLVSYLASQLVYAYTVDGWVSGWNVKKTICMISQFQIIYNLCNLVCYVRVRGN